MADSAGFCLGVERAIKMAFAAVRKKSVPLYSLGPLIHNPQVVEQLDRSGVRSVENLDEIGEGTVILPSHGVTREEMKRIKDRGLNVVDATCPFVKRAQKCAGLLSRQGYTVVIAGDKGHPEIQAILSYVEEKAVVAESTEDLKKLAGVKKLGIVAQTTQAHKKLQEIVSGALSLVEEVRVFNTICDATRIRQQEALSLVRQVDCMIVIGGYNSANTTRLAQLCRTIQPRTYHIETECELDQSWFRGVRRVGITAGASTPHWLIDRVKAQIAAIVE